MAQSLQMVNGVLRWAEPLPPEPTPQEHMARYHKEHCACPQCGTVGLKRTTMGGIIFPRYEDNVDRNTAWCHGCPWTGLVHEMVPAA